ncbi:hypothetical protein CBG46_01000 [Actinobacillus succinogenes]|uniref:DUF8095 domain-containing protein n=1 Tax=Actinobacillus succinogenes (strain ATCC 55618 / DSM 22257 / CCUG 43843 / 130Z) TaxID=339671 RepID=A6VMM5_ACTSZ|nr:hypothetical protein [Actinobacillus succinogenes]ABR74222.1 conserved hypothetical protein [Actinobacillus succinogenes 130Z]PHI39349.1 hypothetical protein CBG46_01000 [Actinobacillus succinogenes]
MKLDFKIILTLLILFPVAGIGQIGPKSTFIAKGSTDELNPGCSDDMERMAESIELEVYNMNQKYYSHTVYQSGAGICRGYRNQLGVDLTDSTTYYVRNPEEYYAIISRTNVSFLNQIKDMQYTTVFNIKAKDILDKLRQDEMETGKYRAKVNVQERADVLSDIVCQ